MAWVVYYLRSLVFRLGLRFSQRSYLNKTVLVGITFLTADDALPEYFQTHGVIVRIDGHEGTTIHRSSGQSFRIPPGTWHFQPARPGEYRLKSTGEVVTNPDFIANFTISGTTPENIRLYKSQGLRGPYKA